MMLVHSKRLQVSLFFLISTFVLIPFGDFSISTLHPFLELQKFLKAIVNINLLSVPNYFEALWQTLSIALLALFIASWLGIFLSLVFHNKVVRISLAFIRSIHEIFWALIFLQIFGLNALSALLAIILPYSAILAKVYAEILEDHDRFPKELRNKSVSSFVLFIYTKLPDALPHLFSYTLYRFECALKSTAILGFLGLPTLGYYLEGAFMQGIYEDVWLLLILFYLLIASIKYWFKKPIVPFLVILSLFNLKGIEGFSWDNLVRFFTSDIIPSPLKQGKGISYFFDWLNNIFTNEILHGVINTIILTQISLIGTAILSLFLYPLISKHLSKKPTRFFGQLLLIVLRSTPEYILAYLFLQMFGPSMLPALIALSLHNGSIIAFIIGKESSELSLSANTPKSPLNRYNYEITPSVYNSFLSFLFYRWEVIMRESAILGILGVQTLGFFIDSSIAEFKLDKMFILLLATALLNILLDQISLKVRRYVLPTREVKMAQNCCSI